VDPVGSYRVVGLSQVEQFTVLWILLALIVLGNSAVLVTLYLNKRKSRMNFFIMQLAGAGKC
jgi:neuropeptide S receptor 1